MATSSAPKTYDPDDIKRRDGTPDFDLLRFHFVRIFNEVNKLDDPESPITLAIVQEVLEGACDLGDGKLRSDHLRDVVLDIVLDVTRFGNALYAQGFTKPPTACEHCGAEGQDADGEQAHYRDCQEL